MKSELKDAREKAGYSIEEVSEKLHIRKQYIKSLEEGDFESLPGKIYVDGYMKMYYDLLGLTLPKAPTEELKCTTPPIDEVKVNSKQQKIVLLISFLLLIAVMFTYNKLYNDADEASQTTVGKSIIWK